MELQCKCGYKWNYFGIKKIKATCPDCGKRVNIPQAQPEGEKNETPR